MTKFRNTLKAGNANRLTNRDVNVNSYNVSPTTIVATAAGTVFSGDLENYDFFNVDQTSANDDVITLPSSLPVGTILNLFALDQFSVGSEASSSIGINGGTDSQEVAVAASALIKLEKISATNWTAQQTASSGAITAPSAA